MHRKKDIDIVENSLEAEESKINNSKVIDFKSDQKTDVDVKDNSEIKK